MTENTEVTEPTTKSFTSINVNQIAVNADDPILQRITDPPEGFVPVGQNGYKFSQEEVSIAITEEGADALQSAFAEAGINVTNLEQEAEANG